VDHAATMFGVGPQDRGERGIVNQDLDGP